MSKEFRNDFEETYAKLFKVGSNAFSRFMSDSVYSDPTVATAYRMYLEGQKSYEEQVRENAALKKLLERAHERLDELKQPTYTGTGGELAQAPLDCVLGVGGFEQELHEQRPITGDEK